MQTRITKLLEIEYPVIQGGMAWSQMRRLRQMFQKRAASDLSGRQMHRQNGYGVKSAAKEITDKPIGVNVMLLSEHVDEVAQVVAEEGDKSRNDRSR